jgi:predicted DsbA family dithiol-disulfide isomerase
VVVALCVNEGHIMIDVWSDVACPWCYIGKRNLETALRTFSHDEAPVVDVEYHSFELSPDTPVEFEGSAADFLMSHRGVSPSQARQMIDRVVGIGANAGLAYDYDALQHTNTIRAHQLLHHAKAHGLQIEMKERLLSAYFVEGRHIGRIDDLGDLAAEVGLDREDAIRALESEEYLADVRADQRQAMAYGINGVPFFVIGAKYGVSGAQPPEVFVSALTRVAEEGS